MNCPATGCTYPFRIEQRWVAESSDGPVEGVKGRCESGAHWFSASLSDLQSHSDAKKSDGAS